MSAASPFFSDAYLITNSNKNLMIVISKLSFGLMYRNNFTLQSSLK